LRIWFDKDGAEQLPNTFDNVLSAFQRHQQWSSLRSWWAKMLLNNWLSKLYENAAKLVERSKHALKMQETQLSKLYENAAKLVEAVLQQHFVVGT
jgi:hypothetical protein